MTIQDLRYVVALADAQHFGRAAELCRISQPTMSTQIRRLEEELGITLFERNNRRVAVTPAGEKIVIRARRVIEEVEGIRRMAASLGDPFAQPLRLGLIPTLGPYLLPRLLPALRDQFPNFRLTLHEDTTASLIEQLGRHELDAILAALPIPDQDLAVWPLFDEPFFVLCPEGSSVAKLKRAEPANLDSQSLLLLTEGHCLRDQALDLCPKASVAAGADFRATSLETLRQLVAGGFGCTLLPALAAEPVPPGAALVPLTGASASRQIGLLWRRSFPRVASLERFGQFLLRSLPSEVKPLSGSPPPASLAGLDPTSN